MLAKTQQRNDFLGVLEGYRKKASEQRCLSLILIDLNQFSLLNMHLGANKGDELLKSVLDRIQALDWTIVGTHLGNDEFGFLVRHYPSSTPLNSRDLLCQADADLIVERLSNTFESAFDGGLTICFSAGIAQLKNQPDAHSWLTEASVGLMVAKKTGLVNRGVLFQPGHLQLIHQAVDGASDYSDLHAQIKRQSFLLHFQPQWLMQKNDFDLIGAEALVRGVNEKGRLIPPSDFLSVAERSGAIVMLGQQVIELSCRARFELPFSDHQILSWNLSPLQISLDRNLLPLIDYTVDRYELEKKQLKIELTESELVSSQTLRFLRKLKERGYDLAVDDFGTEHATLQMLDKVPATSIKIDKSFLVGVPESKVRSQILLSIMDMIDQLGFEIIVEGVESLEQIDFLHENRKNKPPLVLQGYLLGRPMDADRLTDLLKKPEPLFLH